MSGATARVADFGAGQRAAWLGWRRGGLGASEMAAVMGLSPHRTALDVFMDKIGQGTPQPETLAMFLGKAAEPRIAADYEAEAGVAIAAQQVCLESAAHRPLRATLDAIREDGRPVEFKLVLGRSRAGFGDEGTDELPPDWLIQAAVQLIVADRGEMDFAVASPSWAGVKVYPVRRDEGLCRIVAGHAAEFWGKVEARTPPPFAVPADLRHAPALFGRDPGEAVALGAAEADLWADYESMGRHLREVEKSREAVKVRLFNALGSASAGVFPSGSRIERKVVERKEYAAKASVYSQLKFTRGGS